MASVAVESQPMEAVPRETERYVEVPTYEEKVTYVPVKETREIVKVVPVYDVEYVDRVVEVPQIEYVDKVVEVPVYEDVVREVKTTQYVDKPVEIVREVRVPKSRVVEKEVQVPGEIVYVDKPYTVTKEVEVLRNINTEVPVIVAQTAKPIITESSHKLPVEVKDYQPEIIPVDVHLAKPVDTALEPIGLINAHHKLANVSPAQYNTLLKALNPDFSHDLPFVAQNGKVEFMRESDISYVVAPSNVVIEGWTPKYVPQKEYRSQEHQMSKPELSQATRSHYHTEERTYPMSASTSHQRIYHQSQNVSTVPSSHPSQVMHMKPREASSTSSSTSSSSSVSSSINQIAHQIQEEPSQPQKNGRMCCGGSRRPSSTVQLTYPPSAAGNQVAVDSEYMMGRSRPSYAGSTTSIPSAQPPARSRLC